MVLAGRSDPLEPRADSSGIWEGVVAGVGPGALYKYHVVSRHTDFAVDKSDPYAFRAEMPPRTALGSTSALRVSAMPLMGFPVANAVVVVELGELEIAARPA